MHVSCVRLICFRFFSLGIVWKTRFHVDVTDAMKPGAKLVELKVKNLWVNRLIGDQQPGIARRYTYTTQAFYQPDSPFAAVRTPGSRAIAARRDRIVLAILPPALRE